MPPADKLDPLIRVRRRALEEKQKALSELYRKVEAFEAKKEKLLQDLEAERNRLASMDVPMLSYFGPYEDAVHDGVEDLNGQIKTIDLRIEMAREDIRKAYEELKKIEITQENRKKRELTAQEKKEAQALDDIALQIYRRQQDEE